MKHIVLLGCLSVACVSGAPSAEKTGDAGARVSRGGKGAIGYEPDLAEARFFARVPGSETQQELELDTFLVEVTTGVHTIRSRLDISMKNPGKDQVEAVMRLPIPPGAAVTRAVLYVGDRPMEGAFVARERAGDIYRAITARRRDPALITWHGPDAIDVSVFPLEAGKRRRVQLEWIEPTAIAGKTVWYRVPVIAHEGHLLGRPNSLVVDGNASARVGRSWLPLLEAQTPPAAVARGPGDPFGYVLAPARAPADAPPRLVLIAETSFAMTRENRASQRETLDALVAALPPTARLSLLAADFTVQVLAESVSPRQLEAALLRLDGIASAGALDLEHVLEKAGEVAGAQESPVIVYLGRGLDAFGGDATSAPLARLQENHQTLVLVGRDARAVALADVAALTGGFSVDWARAIAAPARLLWGNIAPPPTLAVANAERFFPLETVTGETPAGLAQAPARELEALWTRAHVAGTTSRENDEGHRHRVVTPLTSLLVLETMADYARWGIPDPTAPHLGRAEEAERRAEQAGLWGILRQTEPAQIGSIFGRGTTARNNTEEALGDLIGNQIEQAYGLGWLRLVGTGSGGGGTGEGTLGLGNFGVIGKSGGSGYGRDRGSLGGRRASAPAVIPGQATVRGSLDKEIIRRIIRRHINEVRYCYETQLMRKPELAGRVSVQFVIGTQGQVTESSLQSTTMNDARVESCVVQAVRRWEFPRPAGGGVAIGSYPFIFTAGTLVERPVVEPEPKDVWQVALDELRKDGDLKTRVAQVAKVLSAPAADTPAFLAWWLVEQRLRQGRESLRASLLVGELLRQAGQTIDAVRLLSEAAPLALDTVAAELRRWERNDEADRMKRLEAR